MAVLRARTSFSVGSRVVPAGKLVDSADPIVKGRENLFEAAESHVENTSAAPGTKRTARKRTAAKKN